MKKALPYILIFILGGTIAYFLAGKFRTQVDSDQSYIMSYQIERLNKMIVSEQTYSDIYTHTSKKSLPGLHKLFSSDKKVTLLVSAKAQATYDLSKMDIELDSIHKIIKIKSIPPVEIKVYSDVSFHDVDQSFFNKFQKEDLNSVKKNAISILENKIDRTKLEEEARQQLLKNMEDLYLLAKIYKWKLEDNTIYSRELSDKFH